MNCSIPGLLVLHHLPEPAQIHVHRVSDAIQPPHSVLSASPPASIFPNNRLFSNESSLPIRWPKHWNFSFRISPSNEYSGLISFKSDWFYLLAVQRILKSLLQHHSSKASILWCSAFLMIQPNSYIHKWLLEINRIQMQNENWNFPVLRPFLSFPNFLAYWVNYFKNIIF